MSYNDDCDDFCDCDQDFDSDDDIESFLIDGVGFAEVNGNSSLRAATKSNPRNCDCPTCGAENRLTPIDVKRGLQCNNCADRLERGGY